MGCIIANRGTKTLCNKTTKIVDIIEFFNNKITCFECLVRQDAMLMRDYKQSEFVCWVNEHGMKQCIPLNEHKRYGSMRHAIPHKAMFKGTVLMWDIKMLRGAIKLGKMGVHSMGLEK